MSSAGLDARLEASVLLLERLGTRFRPVLEQLEADFGEKLQFSFLRQLENVEIVEKKQEREKEKDGEDALFPTRQQLKNAALTICTSLPWRDFVSWLRKINSPDQSELLFFDPDAVEFVDFRISVHLSPQLCDRAGYQRACFARKIEQFEGRQALIACENDVDDEILPLAFNYVRTCVYSDDVPNSALEAVVGCRCIDCSGGSDCCPNQASVEFAYHPTRPNTLINVYRAEAIFECTSLCQCPSNCRNRVVQNGLQVPLLLFKTENGRGWGVKTLRDIRRGEFVVEYCGEVISKRTSLNVDGDLPPRYFFGLDFNMKKKTTFVINAFGYGNIARFINSRCNDACLISHAVYIDCVHRDLPRIAFFARRNISAFEELTFDYFDGLPFDQPCYCGSKFCRQATRGLNESTDFDDDGKESAASSSSSSLSSVSQNVKRQRLVGPGEPGAQVEEKLYGDNNDRKTKSEPSTPPPEDVKIEPIVKLEIEEDKGENGSNFFFASINQSLEEITLSSSSADSSSSSSSLTSSSLLTSSSTLSSTSSSESSLLAQVIEISDDDQQTKDAQRRENSPTIPVHPNISVSPSSNKLNSSVDTPPALSPLAERLLEGGSMNPVALLSSSSDDSSSSSGSSPSE